MLVLEVMMGDVMVMIGIIIIEGEAGGLALGVFGVLSMMVLGVRVPRCRLFDSAVLGSLSGFT